MYDEKIRALRMERQHLLTPANETEYDALYRDLQPGQNVYWNGFGQPPTLSFRADFDDLAYNKSRQFRRELIKGRFAGGNLGAGSCPKTSSFSQRCTASRSKTRR